MKAILVKYKGPSNTKGSRLIASDGDRNRITVGYPHELSGSAVYEYAATLLCKKMNWQGELIGGQLGNDHVFIFKGEKS